MVHPFVLHNGEIVSSSESRLRPGQVGLLAGWGVFSTLRVAKGVLFEWRRHYARMHRDAALLRVPFPDDAADTESQLLRLVEANGAQDCTLRVAVLRNGGSVWEGPGNNRAYDLVAFTTELTAWSPTVKLGVVPQARHAESQFAGVKVLSWAYNLTWHEEAHDRGLDEVVLLNERDEVSECTSANLFIAEQNHIWTPPLSSGCLPGITRELLLEEIRIPGVIAGEKTLLLEDLERADEVFITSSTRDVLPVAFIEGLQIQRRGDIATRLREAFSQYIHDYSESFSALPARH